MCAKSLRSASASKSTCKTCVGPAGSNGPRFERRDGARWVTASNRRSSYSESSPPVFSRPMIPHTLEFITNRSRLPPETKDGGQAGGDENPTGDICWNGVIRAVDVVSTQPAQSLSALVILVVVVLTMALTTMCLTIPTQNDAPNYGDHGPQNSTPSRTSPSVGAVSISMDTANE